MEEPTTSEAEELRLLRRDWSAAADAGRALDRLSVRGVGGWLPPGIPSAAWDEAWSALRRALDLPGRER